MRIILLLILTLSIGVFAYHKILERDINVLTLHKSQYTSSRRTSPVLQLDCVGGNAKRESYKVKTVQCYNKGLDGKNSNWKCESQLPSNLKFGKMSVSCEGYDYADDPYVLVGSCGLKYELEYKSLTNYSHQNEQAASTYSGFIILFLLCGSIVALSYLFCSTPTTDSVYRPGNNHSTPRTRTRTPRTTTTNPNHVFSDASTVIRDTPVYSSYDVPTYDPFQSSSSSASATVINVISNTPSITQPTTPVVHIVDYTPQSMVTSRYINDTANNTTETSIGYATTERRGDDTQHEQKESSDNDNKETTTGFATTSRR